MNVRLMSSRAVHERLLRALTELGPGGLRYLERRFDHRGLADQVTYTSDDGKTNVIRLVPQPSIVTRKDLGYLSRMADTFSRAFVKTVSWWSQSPELQAIMPLEPEEQEWIALAPPFTETIGARWDVTVDPIVSGRPRPAKPGEVDAPSLRSHAPPGAGVDATRLFEMNGCAVGGIHYSSAVMKILLDALAPLFAGAGYELVESTPMNDLWRALMEQGEGTFVWLEDREWTLGTMEGPPLAWHADVFQAGHSIADPRDLRIKRNEIIDGNGYPVGRIWRNMELRDIVRVERESGRTLKGLREAVRRGLVFGPLQQDLDHKSLLEVWSTRAFIKKFNPPYRPILAKHVPWTRLCTERKVEGPDGVEIDLPEYARRWRNDLVFKPNRGCGGDGVLIGRETKPTEWERAITRSISGADRGVVQAFVDTATLPVPVVRGGRVQVDTFFLTYGLLQVPARESMEGMVGGVGILGRASPNRVVNVARGGGLAAVLELVERSPTSRGR